MEPRIGDPNLLDHPGKKRGRVVEVIGPAGSGKSTLFRSLQENLADCIAEDIPYVWQPSNLAFFAGHIVGLFPVLIEVWRRSERPLTRQEVAWMAMLRGWSKRLIEEACDSGSTILLDQGPIFLMALLYGFGPQGLRHSSLEKWWEGIFVRWAAAVDVVVWLDAPAETLIGRIRAREEDHIMKGSSPEETAKFLEQFCAVYDFVMEQVTSRNKAIRVFRIDTGQNSIEETMAIALSKLDSDKTQ